MAENADNYKPLGAIALDSRLAEEAAAGYSDDSTAKPIAISRKKRSTQKCRHGELTARDN